MTSTHAPQASRLPYERASDRPGYRWGSTTGKVGFHGRTMAVERPRVRDKARGRELSLPGWEEARDAGFLEQWAMSLMLLNVSTRKETIVAKIALATDNAGLRVGR